MCIRDRFRFIPSHTPFWCSKYLPSKIFIIAITTCTVSYTHLPTENSRSKSNAEIQPGNSDAEDAQQSQSEPLEDYKKVTLKAGNPCLLGEYSPYMSSVPAMPFSFELSSSAENIRIEVAADSHGSIQLWGKNSSEGSLTMTRETKKLSCKPGDIIYWAPKSFNPGTSRLTVRLYKGRELLGTQACLLYTSRCV